MVKKKFILAISVALNSLSTFSMKNELEESIEECEQAIKSSEYCLEGWCEFGDSEVILLQIRRIKSLKRRLENLKKEKKLDKLLNNSDKNLSEFYEEHTLFLD